MHLFIFKRGEMHHRALLNANLHFTRIDFVLARIWDQSFGSTTQNSQRRK